jgi:hypothetical protein
MAVSTESGGVRDLGFGGRVRHLATRANPAFAAGSLVVPLLFVAVAAALGSAELLFFTHVAAGAVWFGFALVFPAVVGPTLGGLDDETAAKVNATLVPKAVFFLVGFSFTTVVSGTLLLTGTGLGYGFTGFWPNLALGTGWGLFLFGLVVPNRLHLRAYYEGVSPDPDPEVLESVEKRNLVVALFEATAMLGIVVIMTGMRLGINV